MKKSPRRAIVIALAEDRRLNALSGLRALLVAMCACAALAGLPDMFGF